MTERILSEVELRRLTEKLDRQFERGMAECQKMLLDFLVVCLNKTHRQLIRGQISLSQYYKDTQLLVLCGQRLTGDE